MATKELSEVKDTLETLKASHRAALAMGESRKAFLLSEEIAKMEAAATPPKAPKAAAPKKEVATESRIDTSKDGVLKEDESGAMNQLTSLRDLLREAMRVASAASSTPELAPLADMMSAVSESLAEMVDDLNAALDMDGEFEFEVDDEEFEDDEDEDEEDEEDESV